VKAKTPGPASAKAAPAAQVEDYSSPIARAKLLRQRSVTLGIRPMRERWRYIFVGDKPYRVWSKESTPATAMFLDGVNYDYFSALADMFERELDCEHAWAIRLALRTTYGQALEAFFALLFAVLQAPLDPAAWLLLYRAEDIVGLLQRFEGGADLPSFILLPEPRTWESVVRLFYPLDLGEIDAPDLKVTRFAELWKRLSEEMLDPVAAAEYNSLKHGFRARAGGSTFVIDGHLVLDSEHGSWFPLLEKNNRNVFIRVAARTWSPKVLCSTLRLIASSIGNLLTVLRQLNSTQDPPPLELSIPTEEDFSASEPGAADLSSFALGAQWIPGGTKPSPVDRQMALQWYRRFASPLVARARTAT
jgi:hypothetical protein